jgi:hypothetical protein
MFKEQALVDSLIELQEQLLYNHTETLLRIGKRDSLDRWIRLQYRVNNVHEMAKRILVKIMDLTETVKREEHTSSHRCN